MIRKSTLLLFLVSMTLSGCNLTEELCGSSETEQLFYKQLIDQTVKLTTQKREEFNNGSMIFGGNKVRDSLGLIHMELGNIKTIKQDPGTHLDLCSAKLEISVPPPMLSDVNLTRRVQHQLPITQYAKHLAIENSINVFTQQVNYSVKPTNNLKKPYVEFENSAWIQLLDELTTGVLLKPTLDIHEISSAHQSQQTVQIVEPLKTQVKTNEVQIQEVQDKKIVTPIDELPIKQQTIQNFKPSSPSFDCSKATKPTDITICDQSDLVVLDLENMSIYKNAKKTDPIATKEVWKESIKYKYACGTDVECITGIYKKSIQRYTCIMTQKSCGNAAMF